jgi:transcription elongation factor Elf1
MTGPINSPTSDTIPINWHPTWPGACESCGTESLSIMCIVDDDTHQIVNYDQWVQCSWCGRDYNLETRNDEADI